MIHSDSYAFSRSCLAAMPARKKVTFAGDTVEGARVQISESIERWSEFRFADGSVLRMKSTLVEAWRLEDKYDDEGASIYLVKAVNSLNVDPSRGPSQGCPEFIRRNPLRCEMSQPVQIGPSLTDRHSSVTRGACSQLLVSSEAKSDVNVHSGGDTEAAYFTQTPAQVTIGHRQGISLKFQRLVREWRIQRGPTSSHTEVVLCPAYQNIIGMGDDVVPLIMQQLRRGGIDHWFWALEAITGAQPVEPEDAGHYARMKQAWLTWWESQAQDSGKRIGSLS